MSTDLAIINSPFGKLGIYTSGTSLINITFESNQIGEIEPQSNFCKEVIHQLNHYFEDPKYQFKIPTKANGTPYQQQVWEVLQKIPLGTVVTYSELAQELGSHARAIGQACRKNPIPIVVPCHRVVSQHDIGGFAGNRSVRLLNIKRLLLEHEQATSQLSLLGLV